MDGENKKTLIKNVVEVFKGNKILIYVLFIFIALIAVSLSAAAFFYKEYYDIVRNPQKITQRETDELVKKVGRLIVLPEGEIPVVATVTDPEKLKEQQFFSNAKLGDKVLIFTNAKKAILYDEAANKILEVAPLNIGK